MYSAFISYRHIEPDQTIARRIERSIELFPIPSVYRKDPKKKHFNNAFRDTDELSLDRDLTTGIDYALSQSEFLIVILSPQYKESPWCLHEIEEFLKTHDRNKIMCVLANGEPTDIFPDILTHIPADDGSGEIIYKEPLCADFRLDPTTADRLELPRLLCTMLGCTYDDLMKRREIYRRKQFAKIGAIALAVFLTIILLQIRNISNLNNALRDTQYSQSQTLAAQSMQHLSSFDRNTALKEAIQALPGSDSDNHPVTPEATYALAKATYAYQPSVFAQIRRSYMQYNVVRCAITPKKRRIVTMDTNGWILVQTYKGERISNWEIDGTSLTTCGFIVPDEYTVLAWRGGNLYSYDYENYARNWGVRVAADDYDFYTSGIYSVLLLDQTTCCAITNNYTVIVDLTDGTILQRLYNSQILEYLGKNGSLSTTRQFITEDRKVVLAAYLNEESVDHPQLCITVWDPETGELTAHSYDQSSYCTTLYATPDGKLVAVCADGWFDVSQLDNFSTEETFDEFRTMTIMCFDMADGRFIWEYDTEMPQTVSIPQIHFIPSKTSSDSALLSVTFEVDNYTFNLSTGELYSSVTLPDSIILIDSMKRESSSFYCCNHKYYTVNNMTGKITEYSGFDPFPEKVQSAEWVSGTLLAFNGKEIYWFENISDTDAEGSITLKWAPDVLQASDCGVNELSILLNNNLSIVDLEKCELVLESNLDRWFKEDDSIIWRMAGTYFDGSGVVITGLDFQTGNIHVAAYNSKVKKTRLLYTFPRSSDDVIDLETDTNWTDSLVYSEGTVYFVPEKRKNTILFYNIVTGKKGHMDVTGLPESMILGGVFRDFISDPRVTIPSIAVSPNGEYLFSTVCDLSDYTMHVAVVSLKTGEADLIEVCGPIEARTRNAAFNEDNSLLALSTDYSILLFSDGYEKMTTIPIAGLGVSSMTWFKNELYVAFTNHMIRHYSASGDLITDIELEKDSTAQSFLALTETWIPVKNKINNDDSLIYVENSNMSLISPDSNATTPLLYVPSFVGWSNENDRFVTASIDPVSINRSENDTFTIYVYPHYTYQDLIEKGKAQLAEME